jgi:hypothetical protein
MATPKPSKKFSETKTPAAPPDDGTIDQLRTVDAVDAGEQPAGPLPSGDVPPLAGDVSGAAVLIVPTPFLVQTCAQVAAGIVSRSKAVGWPGLPALYTAVVPEDEWISQIAQNGAVVLAKRFPSLNNDSTPEFALCMLALPWLMWAIPNGFVLLVRLLRRKQPEAVPTPAAAPGAGNGQATASNRDPRRHGDGQDHANAEVVGRFPAGVPDRPDTRPTI